MRRFLAGHLCHICDCGDIGREQCYVQSMAVGFSHSAFGAPRGARLRIVRHVTPQALNRSACLLIWTRRPTSAFIIRVSGSLSESAPGAPTFIRNGPFFARFSGGGPDLGNMFGRRPRATRGHRTPESGRQQQRARTSYALLETEKAQQGGPKGVTHWGVAGLQLLRLVGTTPSVVA